MTGITKSSHTNVVYATKQEWELNSKVPHTLYAIENLGIDGIIIWQNNKGFIYKTSVNSKPIKIASSLEEYILNQLDAMNTVFESIDMIIDTFFESDEEKNDNDDRDYEDFDSNDETNDIPEIDPSTKSEEDENASDSILDNISEKVKLSKNELEVIEALIESEVDAVSDYSKALNETTNKYARKLYTEIISDESKHLSQLKYLKSMGTDSDYVPKDKEANDELAEILESLIEEL